MLTRAAVRAFSTETLKVYNDVAKQQFVVSMKSKDAFLSYERSGSNITFISTEVPDVFQGKGIGKVLAKYAFNYAVENKLDVTCKCHFLAKYFEKNTKDYKGLKVILDLEDEEQPKSGGNKKN